MSRCGYWGLDWWRGRRRGRRRRRVGRSSAGIGGTGGTDANAGTNGDNGGNGTAPIRLLGVQAPSAAAAGSGGDGAFVLAAPGGGFFTGTIELGQGAGIVYGDFHAAGSIYGAALNAAYFAWTDTSASDFFIRGGT